MSLVFPEGEYSLRTAATERGVEPEQPSPALIELPFDDIREPNEDLVMVRKSRVWKRTMFSERSGFEVPVIVEVLAHQSRDKPFFGDVIQNGPGIEQFGMRNPMVAERGDVIVTNDNMISYRAHERGAVYYHIRNGSIMATLNPDSFELAPANHYILVMENERAALALSSRGQVWVPTMDMETDDESTRHNVGLKGEYGEVLAVGPGRWTEGRFDRPTQQPGDMILYDCSHSTLSLTIKGSRFTLVPCTSVVNTYRGAGYKFGSPSSLNPSGTAG